MCARVIFLIRFDDLSYRAVFGVLATQGVGVSRSRLPASLFEHSPMGQANNTSTFTTAPSVLCALMLHQAVQPPQVCHRQETGQSPLARTCGRTWTFLKRLHV